MVVIIDKWLSYTNIYKMMGKNKICLLMISKNKFQKWLLKWVFYKKKSNNKENRKKNKIITKWNKFLIKLMKIQF